MCAVSAIHDYMRANTIPDDWTRSWASLTATILRRRPGWNRLSVTSGD